jgi:hypothetical protein
VNKYKFSKNHWGKWFSSNLLEEVVQDIIAYGGIYEYPSENDLQKALEWSKKYKKSKKIKNFNKI